MKQVPVCFALGALLRTFYFPTHMQRLKIVSHCQKRVHSRRSAKNRLHTYILNSHAAAEANLDTGATSLRGMAGGFRSPFVLYSFFIVPGCVVVCSGLKKRNYVSTGLRNFRALQVQFPLGRRVTSGMTSFDAGGFARLSRLRWARQCCDPLRFFGVYNFRFSEMNYCEDLVSAHTDID